MNEMLKGTETKPIALYKLFIVLCNSFFLHTLYIKGKKKGGGVFIRSTRRKLFLDPVTSPLLKTLYLTAQNILTIHNCWSDNNTLSQ